jgi:CRISPR-associated protein Cmr3
MKKTTLTITCRDPIVSRDGRPFGTGEAAGGNRMRSVGWPLPSVVAGSLRAALAKAANRDFTDETIQALFAVSALGLFPTSGETLYLPAPNDCVLHPDGRPLRAIPQPIVEGDCDWPALGLQPINIPFNLAPVEFKPEDGPAWWPVDRYSQWLTADSVSFDHTFLKAPATEERTHVQLDPETGASEESLLFTTSALPLGRLPRFAVKPDTAWTERFAEVELTSRVEADGWAGDAAALLDTFHPLGGERRLVHWKGTPRESWTCPTSVREALVKGDTASVRMVLTTPAIFSGGWKPGWLNDELTGTPPCGGPELKLIGFSIQRWRAVSGWSLSPPRGPKPVKRMVPAGGVYFFTADGPVSKLADCWLSPVSDEEQDRRDGFGLAAWGTW